MTKRASVSFHLDTDLFEEMLKQLSVALDAGLPGDIAEQFVSAVYAGADIVTVQVDDAVAIRTGHVFLVAQPTDLLTEFMAAVRAYDADPSRVLKTLSHLQASVPDGDDEATTKWQPFKRGAEWGQP